MSVQQIVRGETLRYRARVKSHGREVATRVFERKRDAVSWAQEQIKARKSTGQATTEYRVPAKYKGYAVSPNPMFGDAKANVEIVYKELKK